MCWTLPPSPVRIHYPDNTACGSLFSLCLPHWVTWMGGVWWCGDVILVCVFMYTLQEALKKPCAPLSYNWIVLAGRVSPAWTYPSGFSLGSASLCMPHVSCGLSCGGLFCLEGILMLPASRPPAFFFFLNLTSAEMFARGRICWLVMCVCVWSSWVTLVITRCCKSCWRQFLSLIWRGSISSDLQVRCTLELGWDKSW